MSFLPFGLIALILNASLAQTLFPLRIIHLNDMHARFEETNLLANSCKNASECIGGYARVVHMVKELKKEMPNNMIYMNAADNFQGTLWYIMFRWNVTQHFLNLLPADVMVNCVNFFLSYQLQLFYIDDRQSRI